MRLQCVVNLFTPFACTYENIIAPMKCPPYMYDWYLDYYNVVAAGYIFSLHFPCLFEVIRKCDKFI